jgi:very-short-patch-repair endonuclease
MMKKLTTNYDEGMWKGAPTSSFGKAKDLRKTETEAEKLLWKNLKNNQLGGFKFRRQHPISLYIADFYCHKLKLIIEIDGGYHFTKEQIPKDEERTKILEFNENYFKIRLFEGLKIKFISPILKGVNLIFINDSSNFYLTLNLEL